MFRQIAIHMCCVCALYGGGVEAADVDTHGLSRVSFEKAAKRHESLVAQYRANASTIKELTARNEQILVELNYLSGYLDALIQVSRVIDSTGESDDFSSTSRLLRLPVTSSGFGATTASTGTSPLLHYGKPTSPLSRAQPRIAVPLPPRQNDERTSNSRAAEK
jgi:hypothetical protein